MDLPISVIEALTQFGVAGLMGGLWVFERALSRRRERQLDATHQKVIEGRQALRVLDGTVRRNTRAIEHFNMTQAHLGQALAALQAELQRRETCGAGGAN